MVAKHDKDTLQDVENNMLLQQVLWFLTTLQVNDLQERALHSEHMMGGNSIQKGVKQVGQMTKEERNGLSLDLQSTHAG